MHPRTFLLIVLFLTSCFAIGCERTPGSPTSPASVNSLVPPRFPDGASRGPVPPTPTPPGSPSSSCDASKAHFAIGSSANVELLEQARVAAQAASARFLRPNEPITTELLPSRLNLGLDQQDRVIGTYCG